MDGNDRKRERIRCKASEFAKKHAAELALARESTTGEGQECETSLGVRDAREQEALQTGVADVVPESQADAAGADSAVQEEPSLEVIIDELTAAELDRLEVALQEARARKEEPQQRDAGLRVKSAEIWGGRYFEPQQGAACGRHALNNVCGGPQFDDNALRVACDEVLAELGSDTVRDHRLGNGWCSHSVLARSFDLTSPPVWRLVLGPCHASAWKALTSDAQSVRGALINISNSHWVAVCSEKGQVFYVDSKAAPVIIEEAEWKRVLALHPLAFLVVKADNEY